MAKLDLSLTTSELDDYLAGQRTVRVATVSPDGVPHVVPLWFVWIDGALFLNSTLGNPTVENMLRAGKASAVIDDGVPYEELRGVVLTGRTTRLGETAPDHVERAWSDKYMGGGELPYRKWRDRSWFRLDPERIASWDFRKIPEARARRDAAPREKED
ncbi:MAG TPA: pyridoxamine 5'-phosphate oxidase family protein [Actinomycetota bacterium]|nr:pyridoxamine 5'-phosphate oxidase family protein [Actinomycetota bacterium]